MPSLNKRIQADLVLRFLHRMPIFSDLSKPYLSELSRHCTLKNYDRKQVVLSEGDTRSDTFVIMKGAIDAVWLGSDGREVIFQTFGPNEILGLDEVADDLPHTATCVCAAPSLLIRIPRGDSRKLADIPELQRELAKQARAYLRRCREGYRRAAMCDLETRLALYLRDLSKGDLKRKHVVIEETQLRIASKVLASRTRINTTLKKWVQRGEISYSRDKMVFRETKSFWRKYDIESD